MVGFDHGLGGFRIRLKMHSQSLSNRFGLQYTGLYSPLPRHQGDF